MSCMYIRGEGHDPNCQRCESASPLSTTEPKQQKLPTGEDLVTLCMEYAKERCKDRPMSDDTKTAMSMGFLVMCAWLTEKGY